MVQVINQTADPARANADAPTTAPRKESDIQASLRRIEDAFEELRMVAVSKLQAVARGRQVRTRMARLEKTAITLQRWFRQIERQRKGAGRPHSAAAVAAASGHRKEWAMEFQNSASGGGLEQAGFLQAVSRACGAKVSPVQAEQLWTGFLEQNDAGLPMSLATFWAICEAVLLGDAHAAEFAAITQEEYKSRSGCSSSTFRARAEVQHQEDPEGSRSIAQYCQSGFVGPKSIYQVVLPSPSSSMARELDPMG